MKCKITVIEKGKIRKIKSLWEKVDIKTQIRGRECISCMVLSALLLFIVSGCATYNNMADLNLTYIGEARGSDANLTYFLQGPVRGEVVVLVPGMGRGACDFRELAAALNNAGYRTVAIQPRGIGRSGPILTSPTYEQFADDVALTLNDIPEGTSRGRAHVIGYEFGNRVARMFAVKYPEHVKSLVLLACGGQRVSPSQSQAKTSKLTQNESGAQKSPATPTKKGKRSQVQDFRTCSCGYFNSDKNPSVSEAEKNSIGYCSTWVSHQPDFSFQSGCVF